ncbi:tyrosine-type recombinase/integrase [Streptomyces prunicolor]|uniref:tyrosine-type recombinase/integrase n=1 Tax=Streptomyces prunicolor TaxID=67348 RepID=UPI00342324C5
MPKPQVSTTTGVSRRHGPVIEGLHFPSRFVSSPIQAAPAVAAAPPRPFGSLARASATRLAELATNAWDGARVTQLQRGTATAAVLDYLDTFQGETWQERWDNSPLGLGEISASTLATRRSTGQSLTTGVRSLFCLRAVRPSLLAFRRHSFNNYSPVFVEAQNDPQLDKYAQNVAAHDIRWEHQRKALFDVCCLLTVQDIALSDLTPEAMLHHGHETRRIRSSVLRPGKKDANLFPGRAAWEILHTAGHFPSSAPATMREALHRGQQSVEQLVDRYPIRNRAVRQLLLDYCTRRRADTDYSTLVNLVLAVVHHFWEKIERINPDQADLRIAPEVYETWRQMITTKDDGTTRAGQDSIVIGVRSFYYDLHTWAAEEPERWAQWVAPCPVPPSELRGLGKRRRRINERSADRTRQRQPLLPALVDHVETRYDQARALLQRAAQTQENESFTLNNRSYRRVITDSDRKLQRHGQVPVRVLDEITGELIRVTADEENAFWDWACVETLRHSGVRIEELCELTHLSIRQYQRPNGEVIALLVVAPSKTDRERVIPMSPELFHVLASIIRRHTQNGRPIAQLSRFDHHDKVFSAPMPFLFQRQMGASRTVIGGGTIQHMLERRCHALAEEHPGFRGLKFTPHDFRRIFTTELVNSGLPIHIGAALLGHLNIQTTRGYVAVFEEDVINHYQTHLQHRRAIRPEEEYRPATTDEWTEFEEHFDKRKVELGSCARPYGTPCQHEHACIRCPMLHVNPKMLGRLDELEDDLLARRTRAETEGWTGEVEGLDLTLTFLRTKKDETRRWTKKPTVSLGIPKPRPATGPGADKHEQP